jgi:GNAT superfamily N-acetyltransferase
MTSNGPFDLDERLAGNVRYAEQLSIEPSRGPCRTCSLWAPGAGDPVSRLRIWSLSQRFGAIAVDVEGIGGVQTPSEHRGRGYGTRLVERAVAGSRDRVAVVFLFGIQRLYSKLGFATCLADTVLSMGVRNAEAAEASPGDERSHFTPDDLPSLLGLFNEEHRLRPWTAVRGKDLLVRLTESHPWRPSPDVIVIRREGRPCAYAVVSGTTYGRPLREMSVIEAAASDAGAARSLLAAVARSCWEWRIGSFTIEEPADGTVGTQARFLGCEVRQVWVPDGEGMGLILDRAKLLAALEGELARRALCAETGKVVATLDTASDGATGAVGGTTMSSPAAQTFKALSSGALIRDNRWLIQLLLGFRSWHEAERAGLESPEEHRRTLQRWFPGVSPYLPAGHSHRLDRY